MLAKTRNRLTFAASAVVVASAVAALTGTIAAINTVVDHHPLSGGRPPRT